LVRILVRNKEEFDAKLKAYKARVSHKIMAGQKLTKLEFDDAMRWNFFTNKKLTYMEYSLIACYEDDEREAFLCKEPAATKLPDGGEKVCILGIHAPEVKKNWLRVAQLKWLISKGWTEKQIGSGDRYAQPKRKRRK